MVRYGNERTIADTRVGDELGMESRSKGRDRPISALSTGAAGIAMGWFTSLIGHNPRDILWWQMSIRAVLIFVFGILLIRLFGRRAFGKQSPLDIVVAIVVGSNLSRALTGNASFLPTLAATTVLVLAFWSLAHIAVRSSVLGRWIKGAPVCLMRDGVLDPKTMRRAGVSRSDVEEAARACGVTEIDNAVLERNGRISVVQRQTNSASRGLAARTPP